MHYWAAPGIDLHLVIHPESIEEVREVAGAESDVRAVHGLTRPEFASPCDPRAARAALGLPADGKVVLVSGGGWGVGDLESAVDTALGLDIAVAACLCGRNDELRTRLLARYRDEERVRVVGFTEQMSEWLAAGDALVHSTGGLTVLEAHVRGCPTISYGWGRGHIRANNAAFRRYGIAEVVETVGDLDRALRGALTERNAPGPRARSVAVGGIARARARRVNWFTPALAAHVPSLADRLQLERRIDRPVVALTFDDGPHAQGTPAVLEELARHGATATFFLVGEQVVQRPALAREIVAAGHEVAVHGYRHTLLLRRRVAAVADDLDRAVDAIGEATGVRPCCTGRPTGFSARARCGHVRRSGLAAAALVDVGPRLGRRATPQSIARRATRGLTPGDVVLLHDSDAYSSADSWRRTAAALPSVLEAVAALGVPASSVTQST